MLLYPAIVLAMTLYSIFAGTSVGRLLWKNENRRAVFLSAVWLVSFVFYVLIILSLRKA